MHVVLDEGDGRALVAGNGKTREERIAVIARVAQEMAGAMAEALAVVSVGYTAWLLPKSTPSRRSFAMVGAVCGVTAGIAQPVGDEDHDVSFGTGLRGGQGPRPRERSRARSETRENHGEGIPG